MFSLLKEIDFLITQKKKPHCLIEVKNSDTEVSENFACFERFFPDVPKIQLVRTLKKEFLSRTGVRVVPLADWLAKLEF